jgi:hypothetical protein
MADDVEDPASASAGPASRGDSAKWTRPIITSETKEYSTTIKYLSSSKRLRAVRRKEGHLQLLNIFVNITPT